MRLVANLRGLLAAALIAFVAMPALAQDNTALTTADDVRAEISQAMDAIASYSAQERDQAIAKAREALNRLDAEIERREQALCDKWAEMSEPARKAAQARLRDLRKARNTLGERYGALQTGTSDAWDELKAGFSNAWADFSDAWSAADTETQAN